VRLLDTLATLKLNIARSETKRAAQDPLLATGRIAGRGRVQGANQVLELYESSAKVKPLSHRSAIRPS
jgi:hypothetical protein